MDAQALADSLRDAPSNDAWVDLIAAYFAAHDLAYGHGTDNAQDEAYWLVRHFQRWSEDAWLAAPDYLLAPAVARTAAERAERKIPLAYLLEEAWFAGLKFFVDSRVLVPRSPCAEIIERCFEPWCHLRPGDRVLDVGTGSGCIAIAIAKHCLGVEVDATDTSADALEVARRNVSAHGLRGIVHLHGADLFPPTAAKYRVIISNPPYVPAADYELLPAEYGWEPREGLVAGAGGLEPTLRLLRGAASRLSDDGLLVVEVGNEAERLERQLPGLPLIWVDFERGGRGVFVLQAAQLRAYQFCSGVPDPTTS